MHKPHLTLTNRLPTLPDNGDAALRGGDKETMMRNVITPDVLKTMIPQEYEDWREGGRICAAN
jgi:hypothetical protein